VSPSLDPELSRREYIIDFGRTRSHPLSLLSIAKLKSRNRDMYRAANLLINGEASAGKSGS
jgi:hypothetical protein